MGEMAGETSTSLLPPPPLVARPRSKVRRIVVRVVLGLVLLVCGLTFCAVLDGGRGSYAYMHTTSDGDPVSWDHCTAIRYQVNPEGAPGNWRELVDGAFDEMAANSGFVFLDAGETANRTLAGTFDPRGTRGEPVLVIWSSQGRLHGLQGDTVGLGGGAVLEVRGLPRLVTGVIALDAESHSRTYDAMSTRDQQLILMHEIGHVLGLDHVNDDRQLMNTYFDEQTGLGKGDIAGLKALHDIPCG
ncbi:matrixin family metalloprotease [Nocardioides sp.]|uniref:matrixin family metalloprotease n=1 Tax=Nocardioides sp. TaxID=35761 RepID=UPI001A2C76BB|nr:matrixin family metalloprotease [Nocardioides sp.]MBJ7358749.1 matrixin family metalloprotease [Nocardioides sp.]